jgi:hypothetical protein
MIPGSYHKERRVPWQFAILLLLPFAFNAISGVAGAYPYGGTRHCVYLSLFAIAGISSFLAKAVLQKSWPVWIASLVLVPLWQVIAIPPPQQMEPASQRVELMRDAIAYLRGSAPANAVVFTDGQAGSLLDYYLGRYQEGAQGHYCGEFREIQYGLYRLVSYVGWGMPADTLADRVDQWRRTCNAANIESVWVFDGGWDENVLHGLRRITPAWYSKEHPFGDGLSVFQFSRPPMAP